VLLPNLRRLLLRQCITPPACVAALLGLPTQALQQGGDAATGGGSAGSHVHCTNNVLEVLSVIKEGRGEGSAAWGPWLAVLRFTRSLQVGGGGGGRERLSGGGGSVWRRQRCCVCEGCLCCIALHPHAS
jgi:hypothetical protein